MEERIGRELLHFTQNASIEKGEKKRRFINVYQKSSFFRMRSYVKKIHHRKPFHLCQKLA